MSVRGLLLLLVGGVLSFSAGGFSDIPDSHWATPSIKELVDIGVLSNAFDKFDGNSPIRRYDLVVLMAKYHRYINAHFGKPTLVQSKSTPHSNELAQQVNELASSVAIIDDLRDQFDTLRNDVTYLSTKESASNRLNPELTYRGQAVLSNVNSDALIHTAKLSFLEENSVYSLGLELGTFSSTNNSSLLVALSASTGYVFPLIGTVGLSFEKGPGQQIDSLGQVLDFKKDKISITAAQGVLHSSIDLISSNRSVLSVGAHQRFAVNENYYLDMGWDKRYAYSGRLTGILSAGAILDQKDIFTLKITLGNYALSSRMSFGGDEHYSLFNEATGSSFFGSVITARLLTIAPKGVQSQMADTYREIGAVDIFGLPIENDSTYMALRGDHIFESLFGAFDRRVTPSGVSYKALAGISLPIQKGLASQIEFRVASPLTSTVFSAVWTMSLSI